MILVTGATGKVGKELVKELRNILVPYCALVRNPGQAGKILGGDVDLLEGDFADPKSLAAAMKGIDRIFLSAPLQPQLAEFESNLIRAAVKAKVQHIVKLSTLGVTAKAHAGEPRQYPLHRKSEQQLKESGLSFTYLRPAPFMQNLYAFAPAMAKQGSYSGAWGNGKIAWIDCRDIAAVAARVLTEDGHSGKAYALTGPEALSHAEAAEKLSSAADKPIRYIDISPDEARREMLERKMPEWFVDAMVEVMTHTRSGAPDKITDTVEVITGQKPRSFDTFALQFSAALH